MYKQPNWKMQLAERVAEHKRRKPDRAKEKRIANAISIHSDSLPIASSKS